MERAIVNDARKGRTPAVHHLAWILVAAGLLRVFAAAATLRLDQSTAGSWLVQYETRVLGDERDYYLRAIPLAREGTFDDGWIIRPPLYVLFLAAIFRVAGPDVHVVKLAHALLEVGSVYLIYRIGKRHLSEQAGLIAAAIAAAYPMKIALSASLWSETFYSVLFLYALLLALRPPSGWRSIGLGVLLGLLALTRSIASGLLPLLFFWQWWRDRHLKAVFYQYLVMGLVMAAVIAPWTIRNWVTYGAFIPIDLTGPETLWRYNQVELSEEEARQHFMQIEGQAERQRFLTRNALRAITENPRAFLLRSGDRLAELWGWESFIVRWMANSRYGVVSWAAILRVGWLLWSTYWLVIFSALLGFSGLWVKQRPLALLALLLILYYTALHAVSHSQTRHRAPFLPLLFLAAAWGWTDVGTIWRDLKRPAIVLLVGGVVAFAGLRAYHYPLVQQRLQALASKMYFNEWHRGLQKADEALTEWAYAEAVAADASPAHLHFGETYERAGRWQDAAVEYALALEADASSQEALTSLSRVCAGEDSKQLDACNMLAVPTPPD
jgi:4-amino-4-deoxy-L-arabinose transferase-like glycosyltransferase